MSVVWDVKHQFKETNKQTTSNERGTHMYVAEKTWAYLTIRQMLEKYELTDNVTVKEELKERALELSLKVRFTDTPMQ